MPPDLPLARLLSLGRPAPSLWDAVLTRQVRRHGWWAFAVGGGLLALAWPLLPADDQRLALYHLALLGASVATTAGVLLHRPAHGYAWWFVAAALLVSTTRSVVVGSGSLVSPVALPWVEYGLRILSGLLGVGFLLVVVRVWSARTRNREGFVDAALVAAAVLTALLAVLVDPAEARIETESVVMAGLALLLAVVTSAVVRFLLARPVVVAGWLLLAAVVVGAAATVDQALAPAGAPAAALGAGTASWLLLVTIALVGAAALHPSMTALTSGGPLPTVDTTRARFGVLGVALLSPAVTTILRADVDAATRLAACAGVVLTLLVCWQMYRLVRARDRDRTQLDRVVEHQHLLLDLSHACLRRGRLDEVYDEAVTVVARTLGPAWCSLMTVGDASDLLVSRAQRDTGPEADGEPAAEQDRPVSFALPASLAAVAGRPHRAPLPLVLESETLATAPALAARGVVTGVGVPLIAGRTGPALLVVLFRDRRALARDEERFLTSVAGLVSGATDRRQEEEQARHRSLHDPLTGLANRRLLFDRLRTAVERSRATGRVAAAVFIDLDQFKAINDTWGHAVGDEVLRHVAQRLARVCRPGDTVARLSGDEFVVVLDDEPDSGSAHATAERITWCLSSPVVALGVELRVRASVGVALSDDVRGDGDSVHELLAHADSAMYQVKHGASQQHGTDRGERGEGAHRLGGSATHGVRGAHEFRFAHETRFAYETRIAHDNSAASEGAGGR